jgi:hypothetical protein
MSDQDTKTRFEATSKDCYDAYVSWCANQKDKEARAVLNEAIHELRKVVSRFEIELAVSERNDSRKKPLSAPKHRNAGHAQGVDDGAKKTDTVKLKKRSGSRRQNTDTPAEE